ncbi:MAG TPA: 2-octaprenyl-6-methoxyphenyl hydroxylase, partial [Porticoccaceae bacterium]|nr:2-octaprenyl-6-methoxyphenyl hydroxylase [Porticoccaceae bacterium]
AGQGFNLSLRDVAVLAEVLGKARLQGVDFASLDVLQRYQSRQLRDQQNTLLFSDGLPKLFAKASSTVAFGRNAGLLMMDLSPGLRAGFAQFGMGMVAKEAEHG